MDTPRGFDEHRHDFQEAGPVDDGEQVYSATEAAVEDAIMPIGGDERRMHVRAYNFWVSLLRGRPFPAIDDLDPADIPDFGPHGVLLDFTGGTTDPRIAFIGQRLREECGLDPAINRVSQVPDASLLARLIEPYQRIFANRAPAGFDAEFVSARGHTTLYRGILTPFSSDGETIDHLYGVINWKEVVDGTLAAGLHAELRAAVQASPRPLIASPTVWADGPSAGFAPEAESRIAPRYESFDLAIGGDLGERLAYARESAATMRAAVARARAAVHRALGRAYDLADAGRQDGDGYRLLLDSAAVADHPASPMATVVDLVFGMADTEEPADRTDPDRADYVAVLDHARRHGIRAGGLGRFIEGHDGGIAEIAALERMAQAGRD
ncbi:hypothetical protein ASE75_13225 [Sphingomonas sp. Leaf17]|uniref:PAS domain-containing protein n=1 Tax=Sphingomonas sp. Leaf17 TaxID=1735683 RepID=UPI0006F3200E|nr:hypothetical protein [Sphingomonas sp. Leaf17]KQM63402.1 hypothetical protein ASE75_13225 [Sphingomonas sp. Leaf17]